MERPRAERNATDDTLSVLCSRADEAVDHARRLREQVDRTLAHARDTAAQLAAPWKRLSDLGRGGSEPCR